MLERLTVIVLSLACAARLCCTQAECQDFSREAYKNPITDKQKESRDYNFTGSNTAKFYGDRGKLKDYNEYRRETTSRPNGMDYISRNHKPINTDQNHRAQYGMNHIPRYRNFSFGNSAAMATRMANLKEDQKEMNRKTDSSLPVQKLCPVTGKKIDPNLYYDYKGNRIYAADREALQKIVEDPEKYIREMEKKGMKIESPST